MAVGSHGIGIQGSNVTTIDSDAGISITAQRDGRLEVFLYLSSYELLTTVRYH